MNQDVKIVLLTGIGVAVGVGLIYGGYQLYSYAKTMYAKGKAPAAEKPADAAAAAENPSAALRKVA